MDGRGLKRRRQAAGVQQRDIAARILRADGSGRPITDSLLSQIESRAIRLPRGFSAEYLRALDAVVAEKSQ